MNADRPAPSPLRYRPEIDGLRAVAVLPVILFHAGVGAVSGGFVGVDVFFVISGFLITSIILKDHAAGGFTLANFWVRRIRRIVPVFLCVLFVTLAFGNLVLFPSDLSALGFQAMAALLSLANVSLWRFAGDYWGPGAESSPVLHLWSLSVEEQFYFVYPLLLALLLRHKPQALRSVLLLLVLASFGLYLFAAGRSPVAAFYLLPTRAWELGAGCLLAVCLQRGMLRSDGPHGSALALLGLALILASCVVLRGEPIHPGQLLWPVLGAALVIACADAPGTIAHRVLSSAVLVAIGRRSYSLYLWHWPALVYARELSQRHDVAIPAAVPVALCFLLSEITFRFIETPHRRGKSSLWSLLFLYVGCFSIAFTAQRSRTVYDASGFSPTVWRGRLYDPVTIHNAGEDRTLVGIAIERPSANRLANLREHGFHAWIGESSLPPVAILGDSHALMWSSLFEDIARTADRTAFIFASAGRGVPLLPLPGDDEASRLDRIALSVLEVHPPDTLFVCYRWSAQTQPAARERLRAWVSHLSAQAKRIVLIEEVPELYYGNRSSVQHLAFLLRGTSPSGETRELPRGRAKEHEAGSALLRELAASIPNAEILRTNDRFAAEGGRVRAMTAGTVYYIDEDHLSEAGAALLRERFETLLLPDSR